MIQNWKAALVTVAGVAALAAVVIVAMYNHVDGALYFWVVAGIVWIIRGNLPEIWGRKNLERAKDTLKDILRELRDESK
ncbi:unnamed protein product [marine sediment metagenome]|uniref:Uncharacterized protein n=1 Tax=marine sediment metagenome TaxID=412755 RepID=X1RW62_9ZZZZ